MQNLSHLPANLVAGVMLAALPHFARLDLPAPTASPVIAFTDASRTTVYRVRGAQNSAVPGLLGRAGHPRAEEPEPVAERLVRAYVQRAMDARRRLDRLYWLRAAADVVTDQLDDDQRPLLRLAARHISAAHRLAKKDRNAAIRFLFAKAVAVA